MAAVLIGPLAVVALGGTVVAPSVSAQPPAAAADFYLPPAPLPEGAPGAIIRAEPASLALSAPGMPGIVPATATRIMYLSSDTHDEPTPVVGTVLQSTMPWTGPGPRPLISFAGGTLGQGDQCAPSKLLSQLVEYTPPVDALIEYDLVALYSLLERGMSVVVTDYHGLGTPDVHDYLNRKAQAYAVLDAARAALQLPGSGLDSSSPVILYGYSQGGMASAGAAELQSTYAPDLNVRGAYVGGPVVDDEYLIGFNDGRRPATAPVYAWILNGMAADYPDVGPVLDAELNETGKAILRDSADQCAYPTGMAQQYPNTSQWTVSGEPLTSVIDRSPALREAFDEQRIGTLTPSEPVFISSAQNDEGAPYAPVRDVAGGWCSRGAQVQLESISQMPPISGPIGTHVLSFFPSLAASNQWMTDRLADRPAPVNCAAQP